FAPFLRFRWQGEAAGKEWHHVATHLIGAYNMDNMLAAITVGLHFEVAPEDICRALEDYVPGNNRSQLTITENNRLIVDAYNANPTSMAAAIENFRDMTADRKMAILGDMGELGDVSAEEHRRVVRLLMDAGLKDVWLVGSEFGRTECPFRKFADVDEVKTVLAAERPEGRCILIKGSHSTRLCELPELL
ncbi:MAG: UDP-N-acetylmuramoyl-tripeptide--D-alanyl-D-alanine ligase, partial [Prevotella sp.]|nr:UDP-N-acetylmuramoyl-tripeptide--D-alanyl-D-alanine ligase [Prevotella sp.]